MAGRYKFVLFLCAAVAFVLTFNLASNAEAKRTLITQKIDETKLVALRGNTRPEVTALTDRGPVSADFDMGHMWLLLRRPSELQQALNQYTADLEIRNSPNFHKFLNAQQFGQRFGLAQQDINTITSWLESHGFKVNLTYPNGLVIDFSGSAAQIEEAFHTQIHYIEAGGVQYIANVSDPRIPAALANAVAGPVKLNSFMPHPLSLPVTPSHIDIAGGEEPNGNQAEQPDYTVSASSHLVVPGDLATIYNLNPLFKAGYTGQGQTIAVLEDTNLFNCNPTNSPGACTSTSDWARFRTVLGLGKYSQGSLVQLNPPPPTGPNNCASPGINSDDSEAALDVEWSSSAAPNAAIQNLACADTETLFGGQIALQNVLNGSSTGYPTVVSISYGESEVQNGEISNQSFNDLYQQAVTQGVAIFVSSGDEGAASSNADQRFATFGITVSGLTSTPYNVSVGGTDFGDTYAGTVSTYWNMYNNVFYASAKSYIPEIPWNDSCASVLIANKVTGSMLTYGSSGFCNKASRSYITTASGSGGPSNCATGLSPGDTNGDGGTGYVGGTCAGYPKPSWQSVLGNPSDGVRDIPDVSLFAANGVWGHYYVACISSGRSSCAGAPSTWPGFGGTSISSPIMAGIQALVSEYTGSRWGNPNVTYYALATTEYGGTGNASCNSTLGNGASESCTFYDVTLGDMDVPCQAYMGTLYNCYLPSGTYGVLSTSNSAYQPAYTSTTGWDFATGIGTVNAYNLVMNWPAP